MNIIILTTLLWYLQCTMLVTTYYRHSFYHMWTIDVNSPKGNRIDQFMLYSKVKLPIILYY